MKTIPLETAPPALVELIAGLRSGEEVVLTDHSRPVAKLVSVSAVRATPDMLRRRQQALEDLRALGGLSDAIPDPASWQREMRQDRPLPGRE